MRNKIVLWIFTTAVGALVFIILALMVIQKRKTSDEPIARGTQTTAAESEILVAQVLSLKKNERAFDIYINRPDKNLFESKKISLSESVYTSDMPNALQPTLLYVSEPENRKPESGIMCDKPRIPHRCAIEISPDEITKPKTAIIKITFGDNSYAEKEIVVPAPDTMAEPTINAPTEIPSTGDKMQITFLDVGADRYNVNIAVCHQYRNDGINPCLGGREYTLIRVDGSLKWQKFSNQSDISAPKIKSNLNSITLISPAEFAFEQNDETIEYRVIASKSGRTQTGVTTYVETKSFATVELNANELNAKKQQTELWSAEAVYKSDAPDDCKPALSDINFEFQKNAQEEKIGSVMFLGENRDILGTVNVDGTFSAKASAPNSSVTFTGKMLGNTLDGKFSILFSTPYCNVMRSDSQGNTFDEAIITLTGNLKGAEKTSAQ